MIALRGAKPKIVAGLLAAVFFATGVYLTFFHSRGFVKSTGTIVSLREDTTGDDRVYYPTVEHVVDGSVYTGEMDTGSSSYKVGKTITIQYDPRDPSVVHGSDGIGIYFMVAGAVIPVLIVVAAVKEKE